MDAPNPPIANFANNEHICSHCFASFDELRKLRDHNVNRHKQFSIPCLFCGNVFLSEVEKTQHQLEDCRQKPAGVKGAQKQKRQDKKQKIGKRRPGNGQR